MELTDELKSIFIETAGTLKGSDRKYNPIERVWGVMENHWNGSLLNTVETVLNFAQTMTWNGHHPVVKLVEKTYQTGMRLTPKAMAELENDLTVYLAWKSGLFA